jgi:hypothetical protein
MRCFKGNEQLFWLILAILMLALTSAAGSDMGTLTVRVFSFVFDAGEWITGPAAVGDIVNVSGVERGLTGDDGTLTVRVPAGDLEIDARRYPGEFGRAFAVLKPGERGQIDIVMLGGKDIAEDSALVMEQLWSGCSRCARTGR